MPGIKLKPRMDKPKVLEVSRAPKDAGSFLKEQYEAQQTQRRPADRNPVQYATDKVELTARSGSALPADGVRRGGRRHTAAAGANKAHRPTHRRKPLTRRRRSRRISVQGNRGSGVLSVNANSRPPKAAGRSHIRRLKVGESRRRPRTPASHPPCGSAGG